MGVAKIFFEGVYRARPQFLNIWGLYFTCGAKAPPPKPMNELIIGEGRLSLRHPLTLALPNYLMPNSGSCDLLLP